MPLDKGPAEPRRTLVLVAELLRKIYDYVFATAAKQISRREIESEEAAPLRQESGTAVPRRLIAYDIVSS